MIDKERTTLSLDKEPLTTEGSMEVVQELEHVSGPYYFPVNICLYRSGLYYIRIYFFFFIQEYYYPIFNVEAISCNFLIAVLKRSEKKEILTPSACHTALKLLLFFSHAHI